MSLYQEQEELFQEYDNLVLENMSKKTRREYSYILKEFRQFQNQRERFLQQSTAADLAAFIKSKRDSIQGTTLRSKYFAVKKFYLFLKKKKLIDSDELEFLKDITPKATKGDEAHRALSEEEYRQCLLKISHPLYRFIFFLGSEFGLRRSEYTNLKLSDVDLDRNRLRIHGKGDKVRFIPITKRQILRFEEFLRQRERDGVEHEFLIYSKAGKTIAGTIERYFKMMSQHSAVKFTSHDLRVTYATRLWKAGLDIFTISKKLGHASIDTTLTYVKPTAKELDERYLEIAEGLI